MIGLRHRRSPVRHGLAVVRRRGAVVRDAGDRGQVMILVLGFSVVALLLVVGGVDVTAVQLARIRMTDAADGAALAAADAVDAASVYRNGLGQTVRISDATVQSSASDYLAASGRPGGVTSWGLLTGTGSPDGQTAVVRLRGTVQVPLFATVVSSWGDALTVTVESRARAVLR